MTLATLLFVLLLGALVNTLIHAMGKAPLWPAVLVVCIVLALLIARSPGK